jgi:hypothetical protein
MDGWVVLTCQADCVEGSFGRTSQNVMPVVYRGGQFPTNAASKVRL